MCWEGKKKINVAVSAQPLLFLLQSPRKKRKKKWRKTKVNSLDVSWQPKCIVWPVDLDHHVLLVDDGNTKKKRKKERKEKYHVVWKGVTIFSLWKCGGDVLKKKENKTFTLSHRPITETKHGQKNKIYTTWSVCVECGGKKRRGGIFL